MSADSHTGRDAHNAGSDTAKHYGVHPVDAFKRSTLPTAPATRSVGESAVKDMPQGSGSPSSVIRDF